MKVITGILVQIAIIFVLSAGTHAQDLDLSDIHYEKIRLVTDRTAYIGGDTIWFRGFVVDEVTGRPMSASRYLYVELRDADNSLSQRVKVMERDGAYHGYVGLLEDIATGVYMLTAYTMFSQNVGEQYFPKVPLRIFNPYVKRQRVDVDFRPKGDGASLNAHLVNSTDGSYAQSDKVRVSGSGLEPQQLHYSKTRGVNVYSRRRPGECVLLEFDNYRELVMTPSFSGDTVLMLYPEGGALVPGAACRMAIKAVDGNGRGISVSGRVVDSGGAVAGRFTTDAEGLAVVTVTPIGAGEYMAVADDGGLRSVPESCIEGASGIWVDDRGRGFIVGLEGEIRSGDRVLVDQRGLTVLEMDGKARNWEIARDKLQPGLATVRLVGSDGVERGSRMFHVWSPEPEIKVDVLRSGAASDTLEVRLNTEDILDGSVAVSVVDGRMAAVDGGRPISEELEVWSELPDSVYRFLPWNLSSLTVRERRHMIDNLLMTIGNYRYGGYATETGGDYPLERGSEISGIVRSRWRGQPKAGVDVHMIAPQCGYADVTVTDSLGEYYFSGFQYPDSVQVFVRATTGKGKDETNFEIYPEQFPEIDRLALHHYIQPSLPYDTEKEEDGNLSWVSSMIDGTRNILLDNVTVTANREYDDRDLVELIASKSMTKQDFDNLHISSLWMAIAYLPQITIYQDHAVRREGYVRYIIDGLEQKKSSGLSLAKQIDTPSLRLYGANNAQTPSIPTPEDIIPTISELEGYINFADIERIDYISGMYSNIFVSNAPGGVIVITTNSGLASGKRNDFNFKKFKPLGVQETKQFNGNGPDGPATKSATLNWNPDVRFKNGEAVFRIPSAGIGENSVLRIEGLGNDGKPVQCIEVLPRLE